MKYEEGDKVLIKDINWYNKNKDEDGDVPCGEYYFVSQMSVFCGKILTIDVDFEDGTYLMKEDTDGFVFTIEMIECKVEEETKSEDRLLDEYEELTDRAFKGGYEKCKSDIELNGFQLPEGYQFKDENGNVINATKIVLEKKKKEYPKTYAECCEVLGIPNSSMVVHYCRSEVDYEVALSRKLFALQKLLICRDAYWKIAGEEMGLGKPWEPDWTNYNEYKFVIGVNENKIIKCYNTIAQFVLAFPTEEMRDAFYEAFRNEIEICKELL
jgi:hypothetical protein